MQPSTTFSSPATRRTFLQTLACAGLAWGVRADAAPVVGAEELARVLDRPVLDVSFVKRPVKIASVELLRAGRVYLVRTRSTDGVEVFASFTPNSGEFMEFKGNADLPVTCATSSLKCERGVVRCPEGPGFGVTIDPDFVKKAHVVEQAG